MAIPDVHEDTATMGANAVARIIDRNKLEPTKIGRIYLGTESALDGSKPTATYIMDMLEQRYSKKYGPECFRNCDVVDMTFACIGAVDAMHNTLDWVARGGAEQDRIGVVVFADNAKYDLGSSASTPKVRVAGPSSSGTTRGYWRSQTYGACPRCQFMISSSPVGKLLGSQ